MKDHYKDKSKAKASVFTSTQDFEPFDKVKKEKKKKQHKVKEDSNISATGINVAEAGNKKRNKKKKKDISEIIYYNCNKNRHNSDLYLEPQKFQN